MANLSNFILCFTYFKAIVNTLLVRVGLKKESGFKVRRGQGWGAAGRAAGLLAALLWLAGLCELVRRLWREEQRCP
jgi:hypothetical protein